MTRPPAPSRRLLRTADLSAFRAALADLALEGGPEAAVRRAILVPTRASAELLRRTIEAEARARGLAAVVLPALLTRDDWLARLHRAVPGALPLAGRAERETLVAAAARHVAARPRIRGQPFAIRPGLVSAMLDFYDELGRRQSTVRRFVRVLFQELRVERGTDRGSEGLIHQTCFLALTFLDYQRRLAAGGGLDEHGLRRLLHARPVTHPFGHLVVAVADQPSDPRGLWPADFVLLGRLPGLARLDVVLTEELHDAGFRERLERELPGIEDARFPAPASGGPLVRPPEEAGDAWCFVSRDREEELREVVRAVRRRARAPGGAAVAPAAVVFQRPLPYLYLAPRVFEDGGVPWQSFDALPLAVDSFAAVVDAALAVARTGGTRETVGALLRAPLAFEVDGESIGARDVAALEAVLADRRTLADAGRYPAEVDAWFAGRAARNGVEAARARRAAHAAAGAAAELAGVRDADSGPAQVEALAAFLRRHERPGPAEEPADLGARRGRVAVLALLDELAAAWRRHDPVPRAAEDVASAVHHAIESRTLAPAVSGRGVALVDAVAARFGGFDHAHLVGLAESDWPERPARSIFYTRGLLQALGWAVEADHTRAQMAAFRDLLGLGRETTRLHAFQLEGDAVMALSPMVDAARGRPAARETAAAPVRVFADEALTGEPVVADALRPGAGGWLALRRARPPLDAPDYGGFVAPIAAGAYRVSRVDRYVVCPFQYFAQTVLRLPEERDEEAGLTPLERGTLVHDLFERFYASWAADPGGTITPDHLPAALERFGRLARETLAALPEADRALEETRLLGSIVATGLAERVFELEADAGGEIARRLLEYSLEGPFEFPVLGGFSRRAIEVRGKADRIDVFADGSLRVIDYKLGRLPDLRTALQVGVYAHCARQALESAGGGPHAIHSAMFLAFGDERRLEGSIAASDEPAPVAVEARAAAFAATVARIEAGRFPARPAHPSECQWCRYAGVCRKEYRLDADAAESV